MGLSKSVDVKEQCEKAAHTLHTFLDNGKIPNSVIAEAQGLAIFSAFRAGMYFAGSSGHGIVLARLPNGSWSPPSAFSVRSGNIGIVYGVDIFDCVCVLNTSEAVEAYQKSEVQLGGAVTLAAGPLGGKAEGKAEKKPVWTYTRSRGLYGGLTLDSTVISEVPEANARFYGAPVTAAEILRGEVREQDGAGSWPAGAKMLMDRLKSAERTHKAA